MRGGEAPVCTACDSHTRERSSCGRSVLRQEKPPYFATTFRQKVHLFAPFLDSKVAPGASFWPFRANSCFYSKNAPHLESAITLGVFVQMFATANCSGGTPKKVSNNILLDPSRKTIFRSTGEIGVRKNLHWGLFGKICYSICQTVTFFRGSETNKGKLMGVNGACIWIPSASAKTFFLERALV